ncbi:hypothetical protein CEE37_11895 [candidate division LCP-89 bacterium B3_LCP]|uniref:Putative zinc-finger domain-containing protein n=1 Tax=candidate division LCP-89 bacterium B3_LCP TaxID=2012998 RepID=A0A532UW01_UNCL8|nr:MAG: hypothetical protein CEE37_11895 [candidate division LCP-89 bacterium B3_LCP]
MMNCEERQVNISAMLDGELSGQELIETVSHLSECQACMKEFRRFQSLQSLIEEETSIPEAPPGLWDRISQAVPQKPVAKIIPLRTKFIKIASIAAALLIFFGLGYFMRKPTLTILEDPNSPIVLASDRGSMDDDQFLTLTRELLSSDPEYHRRMYFILHTLQADYWEGTYEPPETNEQGNSPQLMQTDATNDNNDRNIYRF